MARRSRVLDGTLWRARVASSMTRGFVKSIQRGTIAIANGSLTGTATITSVDPTHCSLVWLGESGADVGVSTTERTYAGLTFTNSTTITATRAANTTAETVSFEVVEFYPGVIKSVQRGSTTANLTGTITAVDTNKASVTCLGMTGSGNNFTMSQQALRATLTNATTVTVTANAADGTAFYWQVLEFY